MVCTTRPGWCFSGATSQISFMPMPYLGTSESA